VCFSKRCRRNWTISIYRKTTIKVIEAERFEDGPARGDHTEAQSKADYHHQATYRPEKYTKDASNSTLI
jgi:hypothetical protein